MGRLAKLKREHIKQVNKTLDEGRPSVSEKKEEIKLKPSPNVDRLDKNFINRMKNI